MVKSYKLFGKFSENFGQTTIKSSICRSYFHLILFLLNQGWRFAQNKYLHLIWNRNCLFCWTRFLNFLKKISLPAHKPSVVSFFLTKFIDLPSVRSWKFQSLKLCNSRQRNNSIHFKDQSCLSTCNITWEIRFFHAMNICKILNIFNVNLQNIRNKHNGYCNKDVATLSKIHVAYEKHRNTCRPMPLLSFIVQEID